MKVINFIKSVFHNIIKQFKAKKSLRIISIILAVVLVAGGFLSWKFLAKKTTGKAERVVSRVTRGTISKTIEGSGTVEAISQYEITSLAKGDVIADYFELGDYVKKDQLLYEVDSASVDKNITRQQRSLEKARQNYNDAQENVSNLNVKSLSSGVISTVYVSVGDTVQNGGKIADVINKDTLTITLPFGKFDMENISQGDTAEVTLTKSLTSITGRVTKVSTGSYVNTYGVEVGNVEIEFQNPGSVADGETASAIIGEYACYDIGEVKYMQTRTITAKTSGEVKAVYKMDGDSVYQGEVVALLESSSVTRSRNDAQMSLEDASLSLEELYDNLDDYSIRSPIDGKVIQKNIKAGEKMDSNSSSVMAIIADLSKLTFDISIDELDISEIEIGQGVSITADAVPGKTFEGVVSNISIVGSAYQGVTSYPVTVTIDNTDEGELIPGMNVEARIIVDSAENVLRVPVSAVNMGNLVIVKDDGTFADPSDMSAFAMQFNKNNTQQNSSKSEKTDDDKSSNGEQGDFHRPQNSEQGGFQRPQNSEQGGFQRPQNAEQGGFQRPQGDFGGRDNPKNAETKEMPDIDKTEQKPQSPEAKKPSETKETNETASKKNDANSKTDKEEQNKASDRMEAMIKNLDIPQGYTVVRVTTGLTDGTYIEIIDMEGSLKEGDEILLSAVSTASQPSAAGNMRSMGGMGGMPAMGGMGGMPAMGGMSGRGGATNRQFGR